MSNLLRIFCFILGFFVMLITGEAAAGDNPEVQGGRGDWADKVIKNIDTNGDGKISFEEFSDVRMRRFQAIDKNRDGKLSRSELDQTNPASGRGRAAKGFDRMDANGDGSISWEELQMRDRKIFSKIDANGDGFISKEELSEIGAGRSPDPMHEYIRNALEWGRF
jgi:Ca2+-binding EF-hand superfamily protein